jgi:hypothetical protein
LSHEFDRHKRRAVLEDLVDAIQGSIEDYNDVMYGWGKATLKGNTLILEFDPEEGCEPSGQPFRYVFELQKEAK